MTKDGQFTATVPPGLYTVTGTSSDYGSGGGHCGGDTATIPGTASVPAAHVYCEMR